MSTTSNNDGYVRLAADDHLAGANNWPVWEFRIKNVFELKDLLTVVDGTDKEPAASKTDDHKAWLARDKAARMQISLNIKDAPIQVILGCKTAAEMWTRLTDRYRGKGNQKAAHLLTEIFHGSLDEHEPFQGQLDDLVLKVTTLRTLGITFSDDLLAIALTVALPPAYDTLKMVLQAQDKLEPDNVIAKVLAAESSRTHDLAFKASTTPSHAAPKKTFCDFCKKSGHTLGSCFKARKKLGLPDRDAASASTSTPSNDSEPPASKDQDDAPSGHEHGKVATESKYRTF